MSNATLIPTTAREADTVDLDGIIGGFRRSRVLFTAVELGLFDVTTAPRSGRDIIHRLGLDPRAGRPFLDALVALGLLTRTSALESDDHDLYENGATTNRYLVTSSAQFLGTDLLTRSRRSYCHWNWLTEALRTGEPQNEIADGLDGARPVDPERCRREVTIERFAELIDLRRRRWSTIALDASLAVSLAHAHPDSVGNVVTSSAAAPGVRAQLVLAGLDERVSVAECDVFTDAVPPTEVCVIDGLSDYTAAERSRLLARVRSAIATDGVLVVVDDVIDDERRLNTPALLSSLDAVIEGAACLGYTASELDGWCRAAGFAGTEIAPIAGAASAAIAYTNQEDMS